MKVTALLKAFLFRSIAILLGIFVGLIIGEIGCRFYYFGWQATDFQRINSFVTIGYTDFLQPAEDQYVWYEIKPNLDELFKFHPIHTNSQGLRDKEYAFEKPKNTFRVAVIGDSFTFGDGVGDEEIYHALAEKHLNEKSDSLHVEFINFGVAGYDLLNYYGVIKAKAMAYNPDLILIGFCGNNDDDLVDPAQWNQPFSGYKHQEYSWFIRNFLLVRSVGNLIGSRRRLNGEKTGRQREQKIAWLNKAFGMLGDLQQESDVPFLVFYLSMKDAAAEKAERVADLCQREGFAFLDSSPMVDTIGDIRAYWVHSTDHHPNQAMHEIYGELIGYWVLGTGYWVNSEL